MPCPLLTLLNVGLTQYKKRRTARRSWMFAKTTGSTSSLLRKIVDPDVSESKDTESRLSETDARASRLAQELLNRHAGALISKALNMAEGGDVAALRLCIERICPHERSARFPSTWPPFDQLPARRN